MFYYLGGKKMTKLKKKLLGTLMLILSLVMLSVQVQAKVVLSSHNYTKGKTYTIKGYRTVTSSNKGILSVKKVKTDYYKVTAKETGVATLTLKNRKGVVVKKYDVLVTSNSSLKCDTKAITLKKGASKYVSCQMPKVCGVKYSSSNKKVATVNKEGKITAVGYGSATIYTKVYYNEKCIKTYKKVVKCVKPTLKSVTCEISKKSLYVGDKYSKNWIKMTGIYSDGSKKALTDFTYSYPTTKKVGTYTLKVTHKGSKKSFSYKINVIERKKEMGISVTCKKSSVEWGYKFNKSDFTVYTLYSDGSKDVAKSWSFSGEYSGDYCTVTVKSGSFSKTIKVKVIKKQDAEVGGITPVPTPTPNPTPNPVPEEPETETETKPTEPETEPVEVLKSVEFSLNPNWVYVGENLASGQIKVTATFTKGESTYKRDVTDFTTNFTPKSEPGTYPVKVTYKNATGNVNVVVKSKSATLQSFTASSKRYYFFLDEELSKDDFVVTGKYADGSTSEIKDYSLNYKPSSEHGGTGVISIAVGGKILNMNVKCYNRNYLKTMKVEVSKAFLKVGEFLDKANFKVFGTTYEDKDVSVSDFSLSWSSKDEAGTYPLEISAGGNSVSVDIIVKAE